jgi:chemotaxis protein methyltransferase CheR
MTTAHPAQTEYAQFARAITQLTAIRLDEYKQAQMERRIRDFARRRQVTDLGAFAALLRQDARLLREFEQHITINVSEFYRNPEAFAYLERQVLPEILAARRGLRIWSAGCSYGAEPYTLAMLALDAAPRAGHSIVATDIDRAILARATEGKGYTPEDIRGLPARLRDAYLQREGTTYAVREPAKRLVRFSRFDLLSDTMTQPFDLVVCRNVIIYFTDEAKNRILQQMVTTLQPGGWLFIGGTETIGKPAAMGLTYAAPCFYVKSGS